MKFSILVHALLAAPALSAAVAPSNAEAAETEVDKRQNCRLTVQWKTNWYQSALRRYRVQLITSPRNDNHLGLYCDKVSYETTGAENPQCYWLDGEFVIDTSHAQGPAGYDAYLKAHREAAEAFTIGTQCYVDLRL